MKESLPGREELLSRVDWAKNDGLVPVVIQDDQTGRVLMLAYMNSPALEITLRTGQVTFWSRSRQQIWRKGETSGHTLELKSARCDCDGDTLLIRARPAGPTCHRGTISCFGEDSDLSPLEFLGHLEKLVRQRREERPAGSYTTRLFNEGTVEISKKLGEEAVELVLTVLQNRQRTIEESADLIYHLTVFLAERDVSLREVLEELSSRHSGS